MHSVPLRNAACAMRRVSSGTVGGSCGCSDMGINLQQDGPASSLPRHLARRHNGGSELAAEFATRVNGATARHGVSAPSGVQAGLHPPRYAALLMPSSPRFGHSSGRRRPPALPARNRRCRPRAAQVVPACLHNCRSALLRCSMGCCQSCLCLTYSHPRCRSLAARRNRTPVGMTKRGGRLPQITSTKNVAALCQPDGSVGSAAFSELGVGRCGMIAAVYHSGSVSAKL